MNKIAIYILIVLSTFLSSCGVGSYSVSSGKEDISGLSFTDRFKHNIVVNVDGKDYMVKTVKAKAYKPGMRIKQTAKNTIFLSPGRHEVVVKRGKAELFRKQVYLSTDEKKIINL